ncbi:MAG: NAD(P)-dependent dehydrogenase (short-subunit alcohol dehydrogenase family) [Nonlabens sp.]
MTGASVFLTGGTSGIGLSIAKSLAGSHKLVNITRSKPKESIRHLFSESVELDLLGGEQKIKEALQKFKDKGEVFSGFVSCSGMQKIAPITSIRERDLHDIFQLNLFSNVFLLKNMLRLRLLADGASVLFLSSISAERPDVGISAYSMTKAALDNFVKVAAAECADLNIRVNSIRPGLIPTPMIAKERAYTKDFLDGEKLKYKLGPGKEEYVADLVKFLISDQSQWITGQNITIDGGRNLNN